MKRSKSFVGQATAPTKCMVPNDACVNLFVTSPAILDKKSWSRKIVVPGIVKGRVGKH